MLDVMDPVAARALLDDIGFLLVPGAPFARGRAYLLVALRSAPGLSSARLTLPCLPPGAVQWPRQRSIAGLASKDA